MSSTGIDWTGVRVLTFDCYGTLIDWETGILAALRPVCLRHGVPASDAHLLELYARFEPPLQQGPFRRYRVVLRETMAALAAELGFAPTDEDLGALAASLPHWPPFPDTVAALERLATRFALGIISNIDDDLFAGSAEQLGVRFDSVMTAERARSYKPSRNNFHRALEVIGQPIDAIVHVAQSLYHDIGPARSLGLRTVWVNRRIGKSGSGATPPSTAKPDLEVPDLATLASLAA